MVEVGLTVFVAGGGKVQAALIEVPMLILQTPGQSGFYLTRTREGRTLFTLLFKDKNDRLEARQIFLAE